MDENKYCEKVLDCLKDVEKDVRAAILIKSYFFCCCDMGLSFRESAEIFLEIVKKTSENQSKYKEKTDGL